MNQFGEESSFSTSILDILVPQPCPFKLVRIGGKSDGSYLVPDHLEGITACYSPGVDNFKDFEDNLTLNYKIKCHLLDKSSDPSLFRTPLIPLFQTFDKLYLGSSDTADQISLQAFVGKYSREDENELMLQMDIEGAEYNVLNSASSSLLSRFRIIVIEFHGLESLQNDDIDLAYIENAFSRLAQQHTCVHIHFNNNSTEYIDIASKRNFSSLCEATFLRNDCFRTKTIVNSIHLPHPGDISLNVADRPPIHPNRAWVNGKSTPSAELKRAYDSLLFLEHGFRKDISSMHSTSSRDASVIVSKVINLSSLHLQALLLRVIRRLINVELFLMRK
ncbi:FkbM family methyltransferase [Synechococcus sp. EJ6-Ellesmere]|uniref:FkbM family methyltransferase n=1 Tax=Synechococcus sp. EJ6-Ellesmere TaxID=2823734 RepID=UPI0020CD5BB9|nr:FkbM family methyltransferase [Synechococcus sp. EJ6-Ellesmere]MCP9826039.1 FkbM family methyltransferase [Synechococcus sp. EJ6-Ellesmere]